MNPATLVIIGLLVIIAGIGIRSTMKRATQGCCAGGDQEKVQKVKVKDKNIRNYPYSAVLDVDGMMCQGCASKVDNALNQLEGVYSKTDISNKKTTVYMKTKLSEDLLRQTVNQIGPYTLMKIHWNA